MYDMRLSNGTLNAITDKPIPELQAWRDRDLEAIYPIVWLDAIHYKIKDHGRYLQVEETFKPSFVNRATCSQ